MKHTDVGLAQKPLQHALVVGALRTDREARAKLGDYHERYRDLFSVLENVHRVCRAGGEVDVAIRIERDPHALRPKVLVDLPLIGERRFDLGILDPGAGDVT